MFSKEESAKIRKEFWVTFSQEKPTKWLLYNTKIKGLAFKFYADRKKAGICLDFEHPEDIANELLYDKFISLKSLLKSEIPEIIYDECFNLENKKTIRRIYIPYPEKFSIHNKKTWLNCYHFFSEKMTTFEKFYCEYQEFIASAI